MSIFQDDALDGVVDKFARIGVDLSNMTYDELDLLVRACEDVYAIVREARDSDVPQWVAAQFYARLREGKKS